MIEFPETAASEWRIVAEAANATQNLRKRLEQDTLIEREVEKLRVRHYGALEFAQELDADSTPELDMMTLASYQTNPLTTAPADMIDGVLKENGLCIMLGPSGSGKSTLALQMVHSLLTGDDWLGQPVTKIGGSVGAMSYDMDGGLMFDWMNGFPNVDPHKIQVVNAYKRGNPLNVPHFRKKIADTWRAANVEVVIIDSFSASFFGLDQNDAATTMQYYRNVKGFAFHEVGAKALIIITHSTEGSPKKARGSTVHHDVADSMLTVMVDPATQTRTVEMVKYRAGRAQVQMTPRVITHPDAVTHLVSLDTGAMVMAGAPLPASVAAAAFDDLPEPINDPDTASTDEEDDL